MGVLVGIVGKPSSGKTTFLNALCGTSAKTADYPFTTIQPNQVAGFVTTPCICQELEVTCNPNNSECIDRVRKIPVKVVDVAGLVPGAYEGKGMGNQFLSDLAQADILIHVVDISGSLNEEGETVYQMQNNERVAEAVVVMVHDEDRLEVRNIKGEFIPNAGFILHGETSGTTRQLSSFDDQAFVNDASAVNDTIEDKADSVIDFDESNPFSEDDY